MKISIVKALIIKESLQIIRDPSSIIIAVILPILLLFLYGYGVNLDSNKIKVGLVLEASGQDATSLAKAFTNSKFLDVKISFTRHKMDDALTAGEIRGLVVIPKDFSNKVLQEGNANIQVIADASEPNIAAFVQGYSRSIVQIWSTYQAEDNGGIIHPPKILIEPRFWYNQELKSRNFLIPGSIAIIMTLIGTLLTALVIAREWERGTMEAIMATPISTLDILLGKLIPYFILGICSMLICTIVAKFLYDVPFRGSIFVLMLVSVIFLFAALAQGLLISTVAKDQFIASQMALVSAFLPAFMLSGFVFEISAMPLPIQALTHIVSARYFITSLHTIFLTGNVWPLIIANTWPMLLIGLVFFGLILKKTNKRLS